MREFDLAVLPAMKLHLNIKYPSLEECYLLGYDCALQNAEEENPFKDATLEAEQWQEGWLDAMLGVEPLHKDTLKNDQALFTSMSIEEAVEAVFAKMNMHTTSFKPGR